MKLKSLSEIKDRHVSSEKVHPDIMINPPDSTGRYYRFQVGFDYPDRFATSYWLSINAKTLQVYYEDFDDEGVEDITLQQWRYWRKKPEFNQLHKWVNGKLVVLENKKHV